MLKNIILLLFFPVLVQGQLLKNTNEYGLYIKKGFENTAFPDVERENGYTYSNQFFSAKKHYTDSSVLIFIPKNFTSQNKIDFIFHFHGWYNNVDSVPVQFLLPEQLYQTGKNAVLIIPQGPKNVPDSYGGKLERENMFEALVIEISNFLLKEQLISSKQIGNIILSGHSGAYRVMAYILLHGGMNENIKEVWLFDGLYSQEEKFLNWIETNNGSFVNIYTKDGGTFSLSKDFEVMLKKSDIDYSQGKDGVNNKILGAKAKVKSIYSPLEHNDVMHKTRQFQKLVEYSKFLQ